MGRPARPFDHKNRSTYWLRTAALHGVVTEVLYTGLSFEEAVTIERSYISHFRVSPLARLVNLTSGGEGMKGVRNTDETRKRKSESAIKLNSDPLFREKKLAQLTAARESAVRKDAIRARFNDPKFLEQHLIRFEKNRASISMARVVSHTPEACAKRGRSVSAYLKAPETRHVGLMKIAIMIATRWKHPFSKLPKDYFK